MTSPVPNMAWPLHATEANGIIYVVGWANDSNGVMAMEAYDPATDSWAAKTPMDHTRWNFGFASINGKLYAVGGDTATVAAGFTRELQVYDPETDSWTNKSPMPVLQLNPPAVSLNGILYTVGGEHESRLQAYDPASDSWTSKASMPAIPIWTRAAVVDGIIYAVSGLDNPTPPDTAAVKVIRIYAYDPATDSWSVRAPYTAHGGAIAAGSIGSTLYVLGGDRSRTNLAYDPASDTWDTRAPMHRGRSGLAVVTVGGRLFAIGGSDSAGSAATARSAEAFTP
jgi:N-acetylneuraminic acid mutarotase